MRHYYALGSAENFYNFSLDAVRDWHLAEVARFDSRRARDRYIESCVFAQRLSYKDWRKFFAPEIDREEG